MILSEIVQIELLQDKTLLGRNYRKGEVRDAQIVYNGDAQLLNDKFVRFEPHQYRLSIPDNLYEYLLR